MSSVEEAITTNTSVEEAITANVIKGQAFNQQYIYIYIIYKYIYNIYIYIYIRCMCAFGFMLDFSLYIGSAYRMSTKVVMLAQESVQCYQGLSASGPWNS
jgi:hypothetical protein